MTSEDPGPPISRTYRLHWFRLRRPGGEAAPTTRVALAFPLLADAEGANTHDVIIILVLDTSIGKAIIMISTSIT
jgi:hypothetical protein